MTDRRPVHSGGCQCGAVRYALYAEPSSVSICHCRMCQKAFGSFFAPLAGVPKTDYAVTRGAVSIFNSSAAVERGFCNACGTPLTFAYTQPGCEPAGENIDDAVYVSIGSLDEPERVKPLKQFGTERRMPWFSDLHTLPESPTEESTTPEALALITSSNRQHPDHD